MSFNLKTQVMTIINYRESEGPAASSADHGSSSGKWKVERTIVDRDFELKSHFQYALYLSAGMIPGYGLPQDVSRYGVGYSSANTKTAPHSELSDNCA